MQSFNLISKIGNGLGLEKDTQILKGLLESRGKTVTCSQFNDPHPAFRRHDVNIFLENMRPEWLDFATENWLIPNTEWWQPEWDEAFPKLNRVLCKTSESVAIWSQLVPEGRCSYLGFEAADYFRPEIPRKFTFLHLAGGAWQKNTSAILIAWRKFRIRYPLIISAQIPALRTLSQGLSSVTHLTRLTASDTAQLMNECKFALYPSMYEGYGHAIHEALGCEAVVLTTGAPPMNDIRGVDTRMLIPPFRAKPHLRVQLHEVSPEAIAEAVERAASIPGSELNEIGRSARTLFLADRAEFRDLFAKLVTD